MQIDRIEQQIESYTSSLTRAVNDGQGAQFSMLLSLINNAEDLSLRKAKVSGEGFELPEPEELAYQDPDSLYTADVVNRLNHSVAKEGLGDFAYLLSHIDHQTHRPVNESLAQDYFARVGLASAGRLMLNEIESSGQLFSAKA